MPWAANRLSSPDYMAVSCHQPLADVQDVADFYLALGATGVEWEDGQPTVAPYTDIALGPGAPFVRAYFPLDASWEQVQAQLDTCTREKGWPFTWELVRTQDWENSWKQYYRPIELPEGYAVVPAWQEDSGRAADHQIILDPGMAFGTGDHPTTKMCMKQIIREAPQHLDVLDLGAGSGILTILAAKMGARSVRAVEPDQVAFRAMQENFSRNAVKVEATWGTLADVPQGESYDLALLNLIADIIIPLWPALVPFLRPGAHAILSGILSGRVGDIVRVVQSSGAQICQISHQGGWAMVVAQR